MNVQLRRLLLVLSGALVVVVGLASGASSLPSTAPAAAPSTAHTTTLARGDVALHSGGLDRSYLLEAPAAQGQALPLVVVLHGAFVTAGVEAARTGFGELSTRGDAVIVAPESYGPAWNSGAGCCGTAVSAKVNDLAFVQQVITDVSAREPIDPARIYVVGYSSGGKLAYNLACADSPKIAAVAVYGAGPQLPCARTSTTSYVVGYGTDDRNEPVAGAATNAHGVHLPLTETIAQLRARAQCGPEPSSTTSDGPATITTWGSCGPGAAVTQVLWRGNDHSWPGSQPAIAAGYGGFAIFWPLVTRSDPD